MSSKLNTISAVAIQVMVTFLIGCSAYHSLPVDWSKQIPGRYEGIHGNLKEVMIFEVGGGVHTSDFGWDKHGYCGGRKLECSGRRV
jgi:hypothetical protein